MQLKNDLLLRALRKEKVERPPVWMMRQAGRYLPDYIKLREKYDFFTRVQTPELACAITLQPVEQIGVDATTFYKAISTFTGAARRLELLGRNDNVAVYKDFAHSPSKLKATTHAVRAQFPDRKLIACMELHTFSSLNEDFLTQYAGSMDDADEKIVYFNPHTIAHKKLKEITPEMVKKAFSNEDIKVYTDSAILQKDLLAHMNGKRVFLMMSSGTFDGMSLENLTSHLTESNQGVHL